MITLNSISHTYPGEKEAALRDVSLTLGDATVTALVGPNGSGKTTLMQILGGLMVPTSGSISIDGAQASADDLLTGSIIASSARDLDDANSKTLVAYARARPSPSSTRSRRPWMCPRATPSTRRSSPWRGRAWKESARSAASSFPRTWSPNSKRSPKTSSS